MWKNGLGNFNPGLPLQDVINYIENLAFLLKKGWCLGQRDVSQFLWWKARMIPLKSFFMIRKQERGERMWGRIISLLQPPVLCLPMTPTAAPISDIPVEGPIKAEKPTGPIQPSVVNPPSPLPTATAPAPAISPPYIRREVPYPSRINPLATAPSGTQPSVINQPQETGTNWKEWGKGEKSPLF